MVRGAEKVLEGIESLAGIKIAFEVQPQPKCVRERWREGGRGGRGRERKRGKERQRERERKREGATGSEKRELEGVTWLAGVEIAIEVPPLAHKKQRPPRDLQ